MKYRRRIYYSAEQRAEILDRGNGERRRVRLDGSLMANRRRYFRSFHLWAGYGRRIAGAAVLH